VAGTGLIALLDDIATIADDVATMTVAASKKSAGIVTDDLAVTADQTLGLRRDREVPMVLAVAWGSLRNKALFLAPGALLLNAVLPQTIVPLLMLGGAYLAYEGVEKIIHRTGSTGHGHGADASAASVDPSEYERVRISGAIRTDFILSAEIIALTLGMVAASPFITQVGVLYGVSLLVTLAVYGLVVALVRLDDLGEAMVLRQGFLAPLGRGIILGTPFLLHAISWIGTVAMLMVGGHILREHIPPMEDAVHHFLETLSPFLAWLTGTAVDVAVGGVVGLVLVGVMSAVSAARSRLGRT
jgi:uncharacterized protein